MAEKLVSNIRLMLKRGTTSDWEKASTAPTPFIPKLGEPIFYTDVNKVKIGNGVSTPSQLQFLEGKDHTHDDYVLLGDFNGFTEYMEAHYLNTEEFAAFTAYVENNYSPKSHTHDSYANQNAFSNIKVGSTTVAADSVTDTLTLAGSNVTLTPDATNDTVTIGITKANVTSALGYTPPTADTHNSHAIISGVKSDGSTQIKGSASSGDITLGDSGVTAGEYGPTSNQTPTYGATFNVPDIKVNSKGIVTSVVNRTVKIPASDNSNTWRKVQLNGTDKLGTGTNTNPLNIKAGKDMSITESSGTFTFNSETNFENFGTFSELGGLKNNIAGGSYTRSQAFKTIIGLTQFYGFLDVVRNSSGTITSYNVIMWGSATIYYLTYTVSSSTWSDTARYLSTTDHTHSSYAASNHTHSNYAASNHTHDYSNTYAAKSHTHSDYAASNHTHNYAGSSSAGGAATSANKVNSNLIVKLNSGTTEGTNLFTFNGSAAKTINITPSSIGAAVSSHGTHVTADTVKSALGTGTGTTKFLREDGTWATPAGATYSLVGTNGTTGLVKNGSSVTSTSGLTACPIISGVPYYKDTNTQSNYGNITTSGTITSTAVTSATGVLVYDSNNKIQRATAANLRTIIGAGTSNLAIGTTSTTAAAGNHTHSIYDNTVVSVPSSSVFGNLYTASNDAWKTLNVITNMFSDSLDAYPTAMAGVLGGTEAYLDGSGHGEFITVAAKTPQLKTGSHGTNTGWSGFWIAEDFTARWLKFSPENNSYSVNDERYLVTSTSSSIKKMTALTQSAYDSATKDSSTLYIIS